MIKKREFDEIISDLLLNKQWLDMSQFCECLKKKLQEAGLLEKKESCWNCEHCLKHGLSGMFCDEMIERDMSKRVFGYKWKRITDKTKIASWCPLKEIQEKIHDTKLP